jgi:hypothetical protein
MALTTFLLQSAKFTTDDDTPVEIPLTSVISATIDETATATNLTSDGSRFVNLVVVDEKTLEISIEVHDASLIKNLRVGKNGSLELIEKQRTCGDGLSDTLTIAIAPVCFIGTTHNGVTVGGGTATLTFRAFKTETDGTGDEMIVYTLAT